MSDPVVIANGQDFLPALGASSALLGLPYFACRHF
jgi:hypothetical protein